MVVVVSRKSDRMLKMLNARHLDSIKELSVGYLKSKFD